MRKEQNQGRNVHSPCLLPIRGIALRQWKRAQQADGCEWTSLWLTFPFFPAVEEWLGTEGAAQRFPLPEQRRERKEPHSHAAPANPRHPVTGGQRT